MIGWQCMHCMNRIDGVESDGVICLAFRDGIPEEILTGAVDHSTPYPGDRGIVYKPENPDE